MLPKADDADGKFCKGSTAGKETSIGVPEEGCTAAEVVVTVDSETVEVFAVQDAAAATEHRADAAAPAAGDDAVGHVVTSAEPLSGAGGTIWVLTNK